MYRCNAPNIYLMLSAPGREQSCAKIVLEKKRSGGYGVVSVFNPGTRELKISRYSLNFFPDTLAMVQRVVCTIPFANGGYSSFECDADDDTWGDIQDFIDDRDGWGAVLAQIRGE